MRNKNFKIAVFVLFLLLIPCQTILAGFFLDRAKTFFNLLEIVQQDSFQKRQTALKKSNNVKGIYLTQYTAGSNSFWAIQKRKEIKEFLRETELNGVVIDVKEVEGSSFSDSLKTFIKELQQDDIWVIARVVVCRDSSLINQNPERYLKTRAGSLWQDAAGFFWLDPACPDVQKYILDISQEAADFGFDEIQFDYLRFPDRGDLRNIVYPCYKEEEKEKREAIDDFYLMLCDNLRDYKGALVLSVDLFGLTAQYFDIPIIGQDLSDALNRFDYISFMLYPSHFFQGFAIAEDVKRNLPALYFPLPSNHPYEVVSRTLFSVSDYIFAFPQGSEQKKSLSFKGFPLCSLFDYFFWQYDFFLEDLNKTKTKIRPWLQDFDLKSESQQGIYYDVKKVRAQIKAAQDAGTSGWLLWNPSNVYTKEALKPN